MESAPRPGKRRPAKALHRCLEVVGRRGRRGRPCRTLHHRRPRL